MSECHAITRARERYGIELTEAQRAIIVVVLAFALVAFLQRIFRNDS